MLSSFASASGALLCDRCVPRSRLQRRHGGTSAAGTSGGGTATAVERRRQSGGGTSGGGTSGGAGSDGGVAGTVARAVRRAAARALPAASRARRQRAGQGRQRRGHGRHSAGTGGGTSAGPFPTQACLDRANGLLAMMMLDEKIAQTIQAERAQITNAQVTQYGVGSIYSQGGSAPTPNTAPAGRR